MTFGQMLYRLRRRSQDLRLISGGLITDLTTQDGIRWSAQDIADACNDALQDASRLLAVYDKSPVALRIVNNNLLVYDDLSFSSGKAVLANNVLAVLGLEESGKENEYFYIEPERFESYKNSSLTNTVKASAWFTMVYNKSTFQKECWITSSASSLKATLLLNTPVYTLTEADLLKSIPFEGINDFLMCLAEYKLRVEEGNFERVAQLIDMIYLYLGVSKIKTKGNDNANT